MPGMIKIRKVADYSDGTERVPMFNPRTGEKYLVNPETGQSQSWSLLGVMFLGDPPDVTACSQSFVQTGVSEGWITWVNHNVVHKPGGPEGNEWSVTHTFHEAEFLVFNVLVNENSRDIKQVRYKVGRSPGKYLNSDGSYEVDWTYKLELVK